MDRANLDSLNKDGAPLGLSEVIEVEKPGAVIHPNGSVGYRFRTLVAWEAQCQDWVFPQRPSLGLHKALRLHHVDWPLPSLNAPEVQRKAGGRT